MMRSIPAVLFVTVCIHALAGCATPTEQAAQNALVADDVCGKLGDLPDDSVRSQATVQGRVAVRNQSGEIIWFPETYVTKASVLKSEDDIAKFLTLRKRACLTSSPLAETMLVTLKDMHMQRQMHFAGKCIGYRSQECLKTFQTEVKGYPDLGLETPSFP
ncbi:MAG TPA: hypothetical protein PL048_25650, partial [Leptospiraceae bacterium]|nr:hypothetical protein [Leptospiraceae bacterium]